MNAEDGSYNQADQARQIINGTNSIVFGFDTWEELTIMHGCNVLKFFLESVGLKD